MPYLTYKLVFNLSKGDIQDIDFRKFAVNMKDSVKDKLKRGKIENREKRAYGYSLKWHLEQMPDR